MPKICLTYAQDMSKLYQGLLKLNPGYVKDLPHICQRHAQDMPNICSRSALYIPKICPRYSRKVLPKICPKYAPHMINPICPKYSKYINISKRGLRFAEDMTKICPKYGKNVPSYAQDKLRIRPRFASDM